MHRQLQLSQAERTLEAVFGHSAFRAPQRPIVQAMLDGRDVLAVLPTGGGKSACFQVPALLAAGPTLVVSPLISLMQDQVQGLTARGVQAAAITSASTAADRKRAARDLAAGKLRLLYVSPERLANPDFAQAASAASFSRVVIDEAHCIAEWGHDFRPDYLRIGRFLSLLRAARPSSRRVPVAAFTATATPAVRTEIARQLGLHHRAEFVASVNRPNLSWAVERAAGAHSGRRRAVRLAAGSPGAAIVFVRTRWAAVRLAEAVRTTGVPVAPYHAGLPAAARQAIQSRFLAGGYRVLCATSAFGMGIDHASIRTVCHLGTPDSLEGYVQQAGRAGRDGSASTCMLVSLPDDFEWQRRRIRARWPLIPSRPTSSRAGLSPFLHLSQRRRALERLDWMRRYVRAATCRRAIICRYFGEPASVCENCDACDQGASISQRRPARQLGGRPTHQE
ncbi:MAG: RecQ family ATP-dependent DNA helicase [Gemmatimonadota bacterium]